jgi:hypothetical protein
MSVISVVFYDLTWLAIYVGSIMYVHTIVGPVIKEVRVSYFQVLIFRNWPRPVFNMSWPPGWSFPPGVNFGP